jgi:microcystin-dependent protein
MWSGAVNTVPAGWALCDGRPGTPNLSNKFIVSAGSSYSVGTQGGADEVTLRADQSGLPAHTHILDDPGHKHRALAGSTSNFGDYFAEDAGNAKTDSWKTTETAKTGITMRLNSTQNASQPFDNRPAYYALAYIIKL